MWLALLAVANDCRATTLSALLRTARGRAARSAVGDDLAACRRTFLLPGRLCATRYIREAKRGIVAQELARRTLWACRRLHETETVGVVAHRQVRGAASAVATVDPTDAAAWLVHRTALHVGRLAHQAQAIGVVAHRTVQRATAAVP